MKCLGCNKTGISTEATSCPECGAVFSSFPVLKPSTVLKGGVSGIDAYQIEYAIGKGGFGVTYRAWDNMNNRRVAIKELLPCEFAARSYGDCTISIIAGNHDNFARTKESFIREGNCLSGLRGNKHIAGFIDFFEENGTSYLVMEYIEGCPLRQKLDSSPEKKLSEEYVINIGSQLADALSRAHANGVYHCDLSPGNIMVKKDGSVVLIDFGAARYEYRINTHSAINDSYSPIELITRRYDIRNNSASDIFMLGMIFYEMLAGERPPSALERSAKQEMHFNAVNIKEPFKSALEKALEFNLEDRPKDISEWWKSIVVHFAGKKCVNEKCRKHGVAQTDTRRIYCTFCGQKLV